MTQQELETLLAEHARWLSSLGARGKQLRLSDESLSGLDLEGRRQYAVFEPCRASG